MPKGDQAELEVLPGAAAEDLVKCRKEAPMKSPAKALTSIGDTVKFEVYWRPGQDQFALNAKIVEVEKRLAQLEVEPMGSSLLETVHILQAKMNVLDEVILDQVEARLKSILGKVKEIAEHEAMVQCANSQSKIHQTYELMQHWDPIASSLPDVLQYLLTLRDLHEEATQVGQVLEDMETMQKEIADALQVNTFLLEVVSPTNICWTCTWAWIVPDFVGDACKALASCVCGTVAAVTFDDFHKNSNRLICSAVFGFDESGHLREQLCFAPSGLVVTSVDIQSVEPVDQRTRDALQRSVQLAIEIATNSQEAAARSPCFPMSPHVPPSPPYVPCLSPVHLPVCC
ncbi:Major vault protein [Anas platyrhynchos]|uniref:Major vault protein n=1 Tax=Anas platyrhynchos TaxID=8839 RepID=R0LKA7_ANAPL|nr:Major vault protein [Anas platyrhynchos]